MYYSQKNSHVHTNIQAFHLSVKFILDEELFYAERVQDAISGIGTDEQQLIRSIVGRCEVCMQLQFFKSCTFARGSSTITKRSINKSINIFRLIWATLKKSIRKDLRKVYVKLWKTIVAATSDACLSHLLATNISRPFFTHSIQFPLSMKHLTK